MRKGLRSIYIMTAAVLLMQTAAFASPTISDTPYEVSTSDKPTESAENANVSGSTANANGIVGAEPGEASKGAVTADKPTESSTVSTKSTSDSVVSDAPIRSSTAEEKTGPSANGSGSGKVIMSIGGKRSANSSSGNGSVVVSDAPTTAEYNKVGYNYSTAPRVGVDLGFTVVSPEHEYGGFKVAEGSVQLTDGSWDTIDYSKLIRGGYYKLIKEVTDRLGIGWYIVAANATRIGGYNTPDGSRITELWLKKNDCSAKNVIEINTSNTTRQNIVKTALSFAGSRYVYGGSGPESFDCSGFVNYVMSQCGIKVPRTSSELCSAGTEVGIEGLRPGDIVGRPGHVGIYIGNGYFIHASESSTGVVVESVAVYNKASAFTNYVNVVGD